MLPSIPLTFPRGFRHTRLGNILCYPRGLRTSTVGRSYVTSSGTLYTGAATLLVEATTVTLGYKGTTTTAQSVLLLFPGGVVSHTLPGPLFFPNGVPSRNIGNTLNLVQSNEGTATITASASLFSTFTVTGNASLSATATLAAHMNGVQFASAHIRAGYHFAAVARTRTTGVTLGAVATTATTGTEIPYEPPTAGWYVSPTGSAGNDGSITSPWSLTHALSHPAAVQPGDTIYLRGGTYTLSAATNCYLTGTATEPVTLRSYPGEWAVINTGATEGVRIAMYGSYCHFREFEMYSNATDRWEGDGVIARGMQIDTYTSTGNKLINLVLHDTTDAVGVWNASRQIEVYGCLIYFNGTDNTDRGHGHSIYTQNTDSYGPKVFKENILFGSYSYGFHAYSEGGYCQNYQLTGNVAFQHGVISTVSSHCPDLYVGPGTQAKNYVFSENITYKTTTATSSVQLGSGVAPDGLTLTNNYFIGRTQFSSTWSNLTMTGNTFMGPTTNVPVVAGNSYNPSPPASPVVWVRPQAYNTKRAHIIVYNPGGASSVVVNASSVLTLGQSYTLKDAQNYFGPVVLSGTYNGSLTVPLATRTPAQPIGSPKTTWQHTLPTFGVFVLEGA